MVVSCSAFGCSERFKKGSGITFHIFPKDENQRAKWIDALKLKDFKCEPWKRLCSKHFLKEDYQRQFGKISLVKTAIPTIFSFPEDEHLKKAELARRQERDENNRRNDPSEGSHKVTTEIKETVFEYDAINNTTIENLASASNIIIPLARLDEPARPKKRRRETCVEDFRPADMHCPKKAKKLLVVAKNAISRHRRVIKSLRSENSRLQKRVKLLEKFQAHFG